MCCVAMKHYKAGGYDVMQNLKEHNMHHGYRVGISSMILSVENKEISRLIKRHTQTSIFQLVLVTEVLSHQILSCSI